MRTNSTWMQTYTGKAFWPLDPDPEMIDIEDIAWSLSMQCRFTGHVNRFYSVAEHCIHCSYLVPERYELTALLHDASEAYLTDIARPVKCQLPEYKIMELELEKVIAQRFDLVFPFPNEVKYADNVMLVTEKDQLLRTPSRAWSSDLDSYTPLQRKLQCYSQQEAYERFLDRFYDLGDS